MEDETTGGSSEEGVKGRTGGNEKGDPHTEVDSVGKDGEREQLFKFKRFSFSFCMFSPNRSTTESIGSALELSLGCELEEL